MFRTLTAAAALVASAVAEPAAAQSLVDRDAGHARIGAFAGARLRLGLGGSRREPVRAGLMLTGVRTSAGPDGQRRTQFGEGLAFGFAGGRAPAWSLAGRPLSGPGQRRGLSTGGTIAVVGGALLVAGGIAFLIVLHEAEKNSD